MEAVDSNPPGSYYTVTQRILRYPPPSFTMYTDVVEGEVVKDIPSFGEARKIARAMDKPRDFDEHGYMRFYNPRIMWFDGKGQWLAPYDSPGYNEWLRDTPEFVGQVGVAWRKEIKAHEMEMILRKVGLQPPEEVD